MATKDLNLDDFNIIGSTYNDKIQQYRQKAAKSAIDLINTLTGSNIQVATAESLTGGLIMSTLVDIPAGGWHKYGCVGVYDTDAKRVFLGVETKELYNHTCAKEMAVGLLCNSNATLAISVTGNSAPYPGDMKKLG